jgi:Lon protease-like protein
VTALVYRKPADLPQTIPLFPLPGAIVFPRGVLPLNIFEPRYLNMIDDALAGDRIIGMIQPANADEDANALDLSDVGTAARITSFSETEDGRYLISLTGICRFRVQREVKGGSPYRQAIVAYDDYAADLYEPRAGIDRERLREALERYVDIHGFQTDWSAVDSASPETLVNAVAVLCPFDPPAKQALLEAPSLAERCDALIAFLEWSADGADGLMQ